VSRSFLTLYGLVLMVWLTPFGASALTLVSSDVPSSPDPDAPVTNPADFRDTSTPPRALNVPRNLEASPGYVLRHHVPPRARERPAILMVPGIGFNGQLFDLSPDVSLVHAFTQRGYPVWTWEPDWEAITRSGAGNLSLNHLVDRVLPAAIEEIRRREPHRPLFLVGHGTGATLITGYLEGSPDQAIKGAVLLAPVLSLRYPDRLLQSIASSTSSLPDRIDLAAYLKRPAPFGESDYFDLLFTARPASEHSGMLALLERALTPIPRPVARELLEWVTHGCCRSGAHDFFRSLDQIQIPVFVLSGIADSLARPEDVIHGATHLGSTDREYRMISRTNLFRSDYGHLDLLATPVAQREIYPKLLRWIEGHRTGQLFPVHDDCLEALTVP